MTQKGKKTKIILLTAILFFFADFAQASLWADFGGAKTKNGLASSEKANETNIAVSDSGKVFLAYQNRRDRVFVREFKGSGWISLPGDSKNDFLARDGKNPTLATKEDDVYVAYADLGEKKRARVRKWNGTGWSDTEDANHALGYISDLGGFEPTLSFDNAKNYLYAAFRDEASGEREKVMRWNENTGWEAVADSNNPQGLVSSSTASEIDIKPSKMDDSMYIAFEDRANGNKIVVKKWTGAMWQDLSDENHPEGIVSSIAGYSPSIDTDNSGNLYLVYTGKNNKNTYFHKWDKNQWADVGGGVAVRGKTIESTISIDGRNYLYLAYSQKAKGAWKVRVKVWNGSQWFDARDGKNVNISKGRGKGDPSLATCENKLYMSFTDARNKNRARIKMLNF
jgi:hypothetical protein